VNKWKARLSTEKAKNLSRLGNDLHKGLQYAFDENIPFVGLWDGFMLGSLSRLLRIKCPEVSPCAVLGNSLALTGT
jgi:hypothetical protein